jgi:hypothetical protein
VALSEYDANETHDGQLVDAGKDNGRVDELEARTADESKSSNEAT